jgi:hypothetical protein
MGARYALWAFQRRAVAAGELTEADALLKRALAITEAAIAPAILRSP